MKRFRAYILGLQLLLMACLVIVGTTPWFYNSEFNHNYVCQGQPECYPEIFALLCACVMIVLILVTCLALWPKPEAGG
jgi:hypothetical protein